MMVLTVAFAFCCTVSYLSTRTVTLTASDEHWHDDEEEDDDDDTDDDDDDDACDDHIIGNPFLEPPNPLSHVDFGWIRFQTRGPYPACFLVLRWLTAFWSLAFWFCRQWEATRREQHLIDKRIWLVFFFCVFNHSTWFNPNRRRTWEFSLEFMKPAKICPVFERKSCPERFVKGVSRISVNHWLTQINRQILPFLPRSVLMALWA